MIGFESLVIVIRNLLMFFVAIVACLDLCFFFEFTYCNFSSLFSPQKVLRCSTDRELSVFSKCLFCDVHCEIIKTPDESPSPWNNACLKFFATFSLSSRYNCLYVVRDFIVLFTIRVMVYLIDDCG